MPVYAYGCKNCGHAFDIRQSFSDDALTECPECGGQLRKKFNTVGVVFKGSGFYRNDSRSDAKSSGSDASDSSAPSEKSESSGASEKVTAAASSSASNNSGSATS
ncbi:FmdB family transcriptional regulator [Kocuria sp. cx-455]|uniref:FmdB family zinc ribbon protein n=1 Tax=unclassified Candidatus Sulfotelmatobacter TaxID=2635724 RepID=UPI001685A0EF|nr:MULTISPECIES: FmdB family zinc ribbon protein [unclassified Candidatus Sulfotelmatobacter]MBD2762430.1 FmdB family transcriptional regulator [Kocuria sp. cx-116]MBD2764411.1 FmdB family transcriptional regulator [Kocuria sp. cx-455]